MLVIASLVVGTTAIYKVSWKTRLPTRVDNFENLRRLHNDLIWCYKILFGLVDIDPTDFFEWSSAVHTRGHPYKLFKNFSSNRARSIPSSVNVS